MPRSSRATRVGSAALFFSCALLAGARERGTRDLEAVEPAVQEFVRVRAVEYSVLARDETGGPFERLAPSDLQVTQEREDLPFRLLEPARRLADVDAARPDVRLKLRFGSEEKTGVSAPTAPHYLLLFIDLSPDTTSSRKNLRRALIEFVHETLAPPDLMGVVSYGGESVLELPFDSDPDAVERAIRHAFDRRRPAGLGSRMRVQLLLERIEACEEIPDYPPEFAGAGPPEEDVLYGAIPVNPGCVRDVGTTWVEQSDARAAALFAALDGAMRFAGGLRDRAAVLAVTHGAGLDPGAEFREAAIGVVGADRLARIAGVPAGGDAPRAQLAELMRRAARQRVALYFVDPSASASGGGGAERRTLLLQGSAPDELAYKGPRAALSRLAEASGGALVAQHEALAGLRAARALERRGRRELLVYVAEESAPDDLDKVRIVSRRPGISLVAHRAGGGGAVAAESASVEFGRARPIDEGDGRLYVPFRLSAPPSELDYREQGGQRIADLTLHVLVETEDGGHLTSAYHFFRHALPREMWEAGGPDLLVVPGWLEAPAGSYRLAALFRNARSGAESRLVRRVAIDPEP